MQDDNAVMYWNPFEGLKMRRIWLFIAVAVMACGGDSGITGTGPTNVGGTWHLRTINGSNLPFTASNGVQSITITGSDLTMTGNGSGTYSEVVSYRTVTAGNTTSGTSSEVGTWFSNGGSVTFNDQTDGTTYQGSVTGNALTDISSGLTRVYGR